MRLVPVAAASHTSAAACTSQPAPGAQGHPGGRTREEQRPQRCTCFVIRGPPISPLFASWEWLLHTRCSLEALDMTVHERNHERGDSRFIAEQLYYDPTGTRPLFAPPNRR